MTDRLRHRHRGGPGRGHARPYSPGLEGVIAGETSLSLSTASAAGCCTAATGSATSSRTARIRRSRTCCGPASGTRRIGSPTAPDAADAVMTVLRALPAVDQADGRAAHRRLRLGRDPGPAWPPTVEQARALTAFSPSALAAFARLRAGQGADRARPVARPGRGLPVPAQRASGPTPAPPARSTRTSSSAPSTASTPRRSPPGS